MARIQHIEPTPVEKTDRAKGLAYEWEFGETQWVQPDTYTGDDVEYPEPDDGERVFFTIAMKVGRKPRDLDICVDVLAVTRDLEEAIEMRLPATIGDTGDVELVNHDGVPAAFAEVPKPESDDPSGRRERYAELLEQAHDIDVENGGDA